MMSPDYHTQTQTHTDTQTDTQTHTHAHLYIMWLATLGYCGIKQSCYGMIREHNSFEKKHWVSVSMGVI